MSSPRGYVSQRGPLYSEPRFRPTRKDPRGPSNARGARRNPRSFHHSSISGQKSSMCGNFRRWLRDSWNVNLAWLEGTQPLEDQVEKEGLMDCVYRESEDRGCCTLNPLDELPSNESSVALCLPLTVSRMYLNWEIPSYGSCPAFSSCARIRGTC